ncbi:594_t:CDS:2 [Funneliformis mosseae]|uniref:594_t:CDS:1 n=1 Tax=Funneliformis mosseae TaxID=27381 RepID=A0A9N8VWW8_FUNMO|nr:594_t:CDS:2 [Funneliformis mosseae]
MKSTTIVASPSTATAGITRKPSITVVPDACSIMSLPIQKYTLKKTEYLKQSNIVLLEYWTQYEIVTRYKNMASIIFPMYTMYKRRDSLRI